MDEFCLDILFNWHEEFCLDRLLSWLDEVCLDIGCELDGDEETSNASLEDIIGPSLSIFYDLFVSFLLRGVKII